MRKPTLTEIKKSVLSNGGTYEKAKCYVNGQDAYYVNGKLLTKGEMIDSYLIGGL